MQRCALLLIVTLASQPFAASGEDAVGQPANPPAFARTGPTDSEEVELEPQNSSIVLKPTYIFRGPTDPETIRQRLARPDLVILGLDEYERLREASDAQAEPRQPPSAIIGAVHLAGTVNDGLARLSACFQIHVNDDEPVWVPIRLDGLTLTSAVEHGQDLPLRVSSDHAERPRSWEVRLTGRGEHSIVVEFLSAVRLDAALQRLEVAIPLAISTSLQLDVPAGVIEAMTGTGTALEIMRVEGEDGSLDRIKSDGLPPREQLSVSWRPGSGAESTIPPMLTARGDLALEVSRGVLMTRSTWSIQCIRGMIRTLDVRLDDRGDELLTAELDDRPIPIGDSFDTNTGLLSIKLPEALHSEDEPRKLTLTTRRTLPTGISARFQFRGFRIDHAIEQSGVVALVQGDDLWVTANAGRGLRQINPLSDLTEALRSRPKVVLAFRFIEQPFDLQIRSDPAPPLAEIAIRSSIAVEPTLARIESEMDYAVTRGRLQELRVSLPEGLEITSVGPESVVESFHLLDEDATDVESPTGRILLVRLAERARASGATFRVRCSGRQILVPGDVVRVGLFRPLTGSLREHRLAVLASPTVAVETPDTSQGGPFRTIAAELTPDWPRPVEAVASAMSPEFWVWTDLNARHLNLSVSNRTLDLHHETTVQAEIDLRRRDLRQETTCHIREGVLRQIEVAVPPELEGRWELDGDEIVARDQLGTEPDGSVRYRLVLGRRAIDLVRFRFLARLPIDPPLSVDQPTPLEIPWIRVLSGTGTPTRVRIAADPGIQLKPEGPGWRPAAEATIGQEPLSSAPVRFDWTGPSPDATAPWLSATAPSLAELPPLLVSRLWLRSYEGIDGERRDTAWYRVESHQGSFVVALPPDSELTRVQVGHDPVEPEQSEDGLRLRLPTEFSGALLVRLDYRLPPSPRRTSAWIPPRLVGGGLVQETLWEVNIPWSRAVVGTPRSWVDENQWYWGDYVWKRRPGLGAADLAAWIAGPSVRGRVELAESSPRRSGYHAYMFGRAGDPITLAPMIQSRSVLVAVCSGIALTIGVGLLLLRTPARLVTLAVLGAAAALAASFWPDLALLALQAGAAGIVLTGLAAVTNRQVERRRGTPRVFGEASQVSDVLPGSSRPDSRGSSREVGVPDLGSDESTVIRRRPATTIDYIPTSPREPGSSA